MASRFYVELPATATFDYPTITALAAYIVSKSTLTVARAVVPAVARHLLGSAADPTAELATSDVLSMSSLLATSPVPNEGE